MTPAARWPVRSYARRTVLTNRWRKALSRLRFRRSGASRSVNRLTPAPAKTLAHLHRLQRSTAYCSRTVAFFFPTPRSSRVGASEWLSLRRTPIHSDCVLLALRTTKAGSCLCGARRVRTLDLCDGRVKHVRASTRIFFLGSVKSLLVRCPTVVQGPSGHERDPHLSAMAH